MVVEAVERMPEMKSATLTQVLELEKPKAAPKENRYPWAEIVKHRSADDLWIVVRGKVYDVTSWVPNHPGGKLILNGGGREATALFTSYHPLRVQQLIHKYEIGQVENYQPFYWWDQSDFYPVLKGRVEVYIKEHGLDQSSSLMYFKTLLILLAWVVTFYFGMVKGYILGALAMGFVQSQFGITIAHDGLHGAYSKNHYINELAGRTMDLIGASSVVWLHQHNIGHHPNSNRQGDSCHSECDQDDPDTRSGSPIIRLAPSMPLLWYHKWQHIYAWAVFCFVTTKWYINDFKAVSRQKYVNIDFFKMATWEYFLLGITKFLYAFYVVAVPLYFHSVPRALLLAALFMVVNSYVFVLMFSVNHLTDQVLFPDENVANRDWARLQVLTATNFAVGSEFWTWMSGGLNYQIEHHLFPYLCHVYLPQISPIVQQACKEYDIPYTAFPSYWDAFKGYYNHLKQLGNPNTNVKKVQ
jgi:fatty acid desaturase